MIRMTLKIDSLILHETVEVKVALPCSILNIGKKFKTVWALHCAMSSGDIFFERLSMLDYVESLKLIVVAPSLPNTFFVNSSAGKYGDFLDLELYPMLKHMLPISENRDDNLVLGVSMGAYGALSWILRKPDFFSSLIAVSGYYDHTLPYDDRLKNQRVTFALSKIIHPYMEKIFLPDESQIPNKIENEIRTFPFKENSDFMFYTGSFDYLTKEQTKHIYDLAMKHELKALYKDVDGEHDVKTWSLAIKDAMDKIFN